MYECFNCGHKSVIWDSDYNLGYIGETGEGMVRRYHCSHCGADIQYVVREKDKPIHDGKECWHCNNFWECEGKPEGVDRCINYERRKEEHE